MARLQSRDMPRVHAFFDMPLSKAYTPYTGAKFRTYILRDIAILLYI
jgi:hypothetical protein